MGDTIEMKDLARCKPAVIDTLKLGKRGAMEFIVYPAIKVPNHKKPIAVIRDGDEQPKPARNHDHALKIATEYAAKFRQKARDKMRDESARGGDGMGVEG